MYYPSLSDGTIKRANKLKEKVSCTHKNGNLLNSAEVSQTPLFVLPVLAMQ